jgi:hypothetical protein
MEGREDTEGNDYRKGTKDTEVRTFGVSGFALSGFPRADTLKELSAEKTHQDWKAKH